MNHPIKATVLRIEYIVPAGVRCQSSYPVYPWDDLKQIKAEIRKAAKSANTRITRLYKTKDYIENPLLKK